MTSTQRSTGNAVRIEIEPGVELHVEVTGLKHDVRDGELYERPTVVFIHGGPGRDHAQFLPRPWLDLQHDAQLVLFDLRGSGRSSERPLAELTFDRWADDIVELCDRLGIEQPVVLGVADGGAIVQRYLTRHPSHPSKVILVQSLSRKDVDLSVARLTELAGADAGQALRERLEARTPESLARLEPHMRRLFGPEEIAAMEQQRRVECRRSDVLDHYLAGEAWTYDDRHALSNVTCPILMIDAVNDPTGPRELVDELEAAFPRGSVTRERFTRARHSAVREEPDRALRVMRDFILSRPLDS